MNREDNPRTPPPSRLRRHSFRFRARGAASDIGCIFANCHSNFLGAVQYLVIREDTGDLLACAGARRMSSECIASGNLTSPQNLTPDRFCFFRWSLKRGAQSITKTPIKPFRDADTNESDAFPDNVVVVTQQRASQSPELRETLKAREPPFRPLRGCGNNSAKISSKSHT
jgi:hypothetical protein